MNKKDEEKKKERKKTILSIIDQLDNLDDLISIKKKDKKVEVKTTNKIDDYFKVDKKMAQVDLEEFKRQIAKEKEQYLEDIKKKRKIVTKMDNSKLKAMKAIEDNSIQNLFGDDLSLYANDPEKLKEVIRKRKEAYINKIRETRKIKDTTSENDEKIEEKVVKRKRKRREPKDITLDPFDSSLYNLDLASLRMELDLKKQEYKKRIVEGDVKKLAHDLSFLEMVIEKLSETDFDILMYKPSFIYRRVKKRLLKLNIITLEDYLDYLNSNPREVAILKTELSINVTKFKRDRTTWDFLQTNLLPKMIKDTDKKLRFWSAAAAIGAEAYSIAMIMDQLSIYKYSIIGTDINPKLLEIARKGQYHSTHMKELTDFEISKYFTKKITNLGEEYVISNTLKTNVEFYKLDLFNDTFPKNVDIIFARNIWIYFEKPEIVFEKMYNALNYKGILILGGTETVPIDLRDKFKVIHPRFQTYQKNSKH